MLKYLILQNPGHNRVYYNSAKEMALAELQLCCNKLSLTCSGVSVTELEGVRYLSFETDAEPSLDDWQQISRLSFVFSLYQLLVIDEKQVLLPLAKQNYEYVDNKISSLLKYSGKTNELFTKMMINVALMVSDFSAKDRIKLLDPIAGKGTTLFEAAVNGFDAYGIELETKAVHDAQIFFKKYIETERYKHIIDKRQVYGKNKHEAVIMQEFTYARNKEEFKNEDAKRKLGIVTGNTLEADKYFKANTFHLLVGDLPYGISHGNTGVQKSGNITRNPSELLEACLTQWHKVLKKGGAVVVAWNSFVVSKHKLIGVFESKGFEVLVEEPFGNFEHMVDKSIKRDIIMAKKV